ncbi:UNVERIFIED_CONTAM: hypothetical protein H355_002152 [Colinus virginianus]|nr:hypothetical protein H355_002152 [Colinus virginianus]
MARVSHLLCTAIAGKKCDKLKMEDEEGYTTLNLRPPASVITDGHFSNNKCPTLNTPANFVTENRVSVSSAIRQPATLAFFILSLMLLTGLVVLLSLFFQIYKDPEQGKKLQAMKEALCFEMRAKNAMWKYSEAGSCFYISKQKKTWKESQEFCSTRNSTLLVLKDKVSLPYDSQFYWVGLSYISERNGWFWEDGTALSGEAKTRTVLHEHNFCASLYGQIIYASNSCSTKQFWICEKDVVQFA